MQDTHTTDISPDRRAVRVAVAELNSVVGDFDRNISAVAAAARHAADAGADLLATPEMALCGYPIEDLAFDPAFVTASRDAALELAKQLAATPDTAQLTVVVGTCWPADAPDAPDLDTDAIDTERRQALNVAAVIRAGDVVAVHAKRRLPTYSVFDEGRVFHAGAGVTPTIIDLDTSGGHTVRAAITVCEDFWDPAIPAAAGDAGADMVVAVNASPYQLGKPQRRAGVVADIAGSGLAIVFVNRTGTQDDIVFDGGSIVAAGDTIVTTGSFAGHSSPTHIATISVDDNIVEATTMRPAELGAPAHILTLDDRAAGELWAALVEGTRRYVNTIGFNEAVVGLSGGIDSAVVAAVAIDALGADRVIGIAMPGPYSSQHSLDDARQLADRCGIAFHIVPITDSFDVVHRALIDTAQPVNCPANTRPQPGTRTPDAKPQPGAATFSDDSFDVTEENLQARLRGMTLMAYANKRGGIVLSTSNKSESSVGYGTLYGDLAGGWSVIRDVPKSAVWALARWRNQHLPHPEAVLAPIPESSIIKAPSAELAPGQLDTNSLPPYELLDAILDALIERRASVDVAAADPQVTAAARQLDISSDEVELVVGRVAQLVARAEHKRRQAPLGPKVTAVAFGRDRRIPIMSSWPPRR